MSKEVVKAESLADNQGAGDVGVDTTAGLDGPKVQHALGGLLTRVNARLFGARYEGGSAATFRKYLNFKGNVAVADNVGLDSLDVEILEQDFRWMGVWSSATAYQQDDFVTRSGNMYRSKTSHAANATAPESDAVNWELAVSKGADGPGSGGAHAGTHKGDGSDPIASATTTVSGLMSGGDKAKLDGVETGAKATHNNLTGLTSGDPHTQYARADGSRLLLATSVSSPTTNQLRLNGEVLQRWNGTTWVTVRADIDPSQPLGVDPTDVAAGYSIIAHVTSGTRPASALEGQVIYETDTEIYYYNVSETLGTPIWTPLVPNVASWRPAWAEQAGPDAVFCAWGDGDPASAAAHLNVADLVSQPTPSNVTTTVVRLVRFRLPKTLNVASARLFSSSGGSPTVYRLGIYNATSGARDWDSGLFNSGATNSFVSLSAGFPLTLSANADYWLAFSVSSGSSSASHFKTAAAPVDGAVWASGSPLSGRSIGMPQFARVATTGGLMPSTLPAPLEPNWANTRGTLPYVFLVGTAS